MMNANEIPAGGDVSVDSVVVQGSSAAFVQQVQAGKHCFTTDEPVSMGGDDSGPSPYDLLLAALGSCTSMTISMYARRKEWPLRDVAVRLRHFRQKPTNGGKGIEVIEREIVLNGTLDDTQRTRLLEIADRCPLHRTLSSQIEIRTHSA